MKAGRAVLIVLAAIGTGACSDVPTAPDPTATTATQRARPGTGLVLDNFTTVTVPVLNVPLGDLVIQQAIITDLKLVEDIVSGVIGLEAEGVVELTGGVLGTTVLTQDFTTTLGITSSGPGQCDLVSVDLGTIDVTLLHPLAEVDVPAASVTGRGSGAVGSLLCNLGALLSAPGAAIGGIVNALNNLI